MPSGCLAGAQCTNIGKERRTSYLLDRHVVDEHRLLALITEVEISVTLELQLCMMPGDSAGITLFR